MSAKHSPLQWEVVKHSWSDTSILAGNRTVAFLTIANEATEETQSALEAEMAGHARLIAAAPELLEALKFAAKYDAMQMEKRSVHVLPAQLGNAIRAAIAKATGTEGV